ncbi:hypothetical protein [Pseudorhodoferax sp. Leaf267]|uniref:hypothetical protein n=1 Tax=Pseudorhodoferax sp. Leaf267 TaxID=1736316 RepID=UPI0006FEA628|nr:hypothetical protein [Pseudorhodoferax sp. Leaf267]KQP11796.1 hypothetical protein ASF43_22805 [Pseudorhodoferax sp. Leaf267]
MPDTHKPDPADQPRIDEEPGITQEEAVPSDGKDTHGEKMMEELGRDKPGPKLSNTPAEKE